MLDAASRDALERHVPGRSLHAATSTSCSPIPTWTPSPSRRPSPPTPSSLVVRSRPASTASWRSRLPRTPLRPSASPPLADERDLVLMVGHLLCYHPGVRQLADLIASGELGEVYYLYSQRLNLGKLRADENALWSLGAHDVSVLLELADGNPSRGLRAGRGLCARGRRGRGLRLHPLRHGPSRTPPSLLARPPQDAEAHRGRARTGWRRSTTWRWSESSRSGTRASTASAESYGEYITRSGAVWSPAVPNHEPLRLECEHFIECVRTGSRPHTDGAAGVRVVQVLEALQTSLENGGAPRRSGRRWRAAPRPEAGRGRGV